MVDIEKQMQFYINLGIYTESELELIRKKLNNENKNVTSSSVPGIEPISGPRTQTDIDIANVRENIVASGGVLQPETDINVSDMEYVGDNSTLQITMADGTVYGPLLSIHVVKIEIILPFRFSANHLLPIAFVM